MLSRGDLVEVLRGCRLGGGASGLGTHARRPRSALVRQPGRPACGENNYPEEARGVDGAG